MTVLLLAGTSEAKQIAAGLNVRGIEVLASLAGATRAPKDLGVETRIGGFGGADGFRQVLTDRAITAVIDATHPYAAAITDRSAQICTDLGLPYLHVLRPAWEPRAGDNWTQIACEEDAAGIIPLGDTVFLGTGRQTLARFSGLEGCRVICRQIDPPNAPFPFEGGEFLIGRPPFPVSREKALFKALGVNWLVVKNAGGVASATKLTAARELGIPVLMIARPNLPDVARVDNVSAALKWAEAL